MAGDKEGKRVSRSGRARPRLLRGTALAVSTLLHGAAAFFLIGSASGDLVSSGSQGAEGEVFAVSLVTPSIAEAAPAEAASDLAPLAARLAPPRPDDPLLVPAAARSDPMAKLWRRLNREAESSPQPSDTPSPSRAQSQPLAAGGREGDAHGRDHAGAAAASADATGDLWGRIEPCWRKEARRAAVPVTLEIELNARGQLSAPPKILRARTAALDEQRLASEASALASLVACLPRKDLRFGQATYRLEFRP